MDNVKFNKCQTPLEELGLEKQPQEVQEQFWDYINNVPFIRWLVSPDRPLVSELPRDEYGKAIIDITKPPILENTDFFRQTAITFQQTGKFTHLRPNRNPQSDFGKWIREERRRSWEGLIDPSTGMWIAGDQYYFLNYSPMQLIKQDKLGKKIRVVDFPNFWDGHFLVDHYLYRARLEGHHAAMLSSRGKGKALPLDVVIPTPEGYKEWKNINVGDRLWDADGNTTIVTDIPYYGDIDIYLITLADGRKIKCSAEHLFEITYYQTKQVKDVQWIKEHYLHHRNISEKNPTGTEYTITIPINGSIYFEYQKIPIEAYTLGLILGDGCLKNKGYRNVTRLTGALADVDFYRTQVPYEIRSHASRPIENSIIRKDIVKDLDFLGLSGKNSHEKFIPDIYKYNSTEIRISLLQGLIDTDGWVNGSTQCYCTCSERLKDDVLEVARSLGIKAYSFKKKDAWTISFQTDIILCRLPRKVSKIKKPSARYLKTSKRVTIVDVQYIGKGIGKCVTVDNDRGLFLANDYIVTHNSFKGASMLAKRYTLGESSEVRKKVQCVVTAADRKYIYGANQILNMFCADIDFTAINTQFAAHRLVDSAQSLNWVSGYKDKDTGVRMGSGNSVMGITSGDDQSKLNGTRGQLYLIEEAGIFKDLLSLYQMIRPSVEDGKDVYGLIYMYGTAGDDMSDFTALQEIMYNPRGYNMLALPNVYDKEGQGRKEFTLFFPAYLNRSSCMDKDGNSDVTKALLEILADRYTVKYNSTDINAITKRISQYPITPQEAIVRSHGSLFPVTELNERLNQIDNNPGEYDDVYVGELVEKEIGNIEFRPTGDIPIREFPTKDNKVAGAMEIFQMPQKDAKGIVFSERYLLSCDPYDDDASHTMSLGSILVLDLWTDRIVAEYTGRPMFADDFFEIARKMSFFWNGKLMYENNKKGLFAYFSKKNCVYKLADTPEYLKDRQLIKEIGYGNKGKGIPMYGGSGKGGLRDYGYRLIKDWLLLPTTVIEKDEQGNDVETKIPNLYHIRNRALLKELILFNPDINVDRIMSLMQLMLYREEKMILYQGDVRSQEVKPTGIEADEYWIKNYPGKKEFKWQ